MEGSFVCEMHDGFVDGVSFFRGAVEPCSLYALVES